MNYALLVGVNDYKSDDIKNLNGCENDVKAWKKYLKRQFGEEISISSLVSIDATRKNIVEEFQTHLGKAKEGELAFFFFSGHGCQEPSPEEFWKHQKGRKHENIVPHDSLEGAEDIADKELQFLIREVSSNGAEVVVVFDCCHAGSGTRNKVKEVFRKSPNRNGPRNKSDFLEGVFENIGEDGRHVFISACKEGQLSRERVMGIGDNAKWGGLFTDVLLETLNQFQQPGMIDYANLASVIEMNMSLRLDSPIQTPKLEAIGGFDVNKYFLQSKGDNRTPDKFIIAQIDDVWKVNIGRVHGLDQRKKALFALYLDEEMTKFYGVVETTHIGLAYSEIKWPNGYAPIDGVNIIVRAMHLPYERIPLWVPESQMAKFIQEVGKLPKASDWNDKISSNSVSKEFFENTFLFTSHEEGPIYGVEDRGDYWVPLYVETKTRVYPNAKVSKSLSFQTLAKGLMHIAQWHRLAHLENVPSALAYEKARQELIFIGSETGQELVKQNVTIDHVPMMEEKKVEKNGSDTSKLFYKNPVKFKILAKNNSAINLFCKAFYLSRHFSSHEVMDLEISADSNPRQLEKDYFVIPESYINQIGERYKFLFSSKEFPFLNVASPIKLKDLVDPLREAPRKDVDKDKDLNFEVELEEEETWFTLDMNIKLLRTLGEIRNGAGNLEVQNKRVLIKGPSSFTGKISLSSSAKHMGGARSDRFIKEVCDNLDLNLVDFSDYGNHETLLELHSMEGLEDLSGQNSLNISLDSKDNYNLSKVLLCTLPGNLFELPPGLKGKVSLDENWLSAIPILGSSDPDEEGNYTFSLSKIPENPDDGRLESGNSLKLSFILVPEAKSYIMDYFIEEDSSGLKYLIYKQEKFEMDEDIDD